MIDYDKLALERRIAFGAYDTWRTRVVYDYEWRCRDCRLKVDGSGECGCIWVDFTAPSEPAKHDG